MKVIDENKTVSFATERYIAEVIVMMRKLGPVYIECHWETMQRRVIKEMRNRPQLKTKVSKRGLNRNGNIFFRRVGR